MKIALFVEGQSDEKTMRILVHKILGEQVGIVSRVKNRGDLLNKKKVCSHIINDIFQEHSDVSKILVCIDSESTPPQEIKREVRKLEKAIASEVKHPIYYIIIIHALEGWLLTDAESIGKYLGPRVKVNIPASAASECRPKEIMSNIFGQAGKEFLPTRDNPRIAQMVQPDEIARLNRSFAKFMEKIKDP